MKVTRILESLDCDNCAPVSIIVTICPAASDLKPAARKHQRSAPEKRTKFTRLGGDMKLCEALVKAVETGHLPNCDKNSPFRESLQHKAF